MKKEIFDPTSSEPYPLSRNKIEMFFECPRCFYLWVRRGRRRPSTPPFTINMAVDELMKRRWDHYRQRQQPDPLMAANGISGVPFAHPELKTWQTYADGMGGIQFTDPRTNFKVIGVLDDVWDTQGEGLSVIDTKAGDDAEEQLTSSSYWSCYQRQMDIYSWILERNGFKVSPNAYFIWAQAVCKKREDNDEERILGNAASITLKFKLSVIPHAVSTGSIEALLVQIKGCLVSDSIPRVRRKPICKHCRFRSRIRP